MITAQQYIAKFGIKKLITSCEKKALLYTQLMKEDKVPSSIGVSPNVKKKLGWRRYLELVWYYCNLYDKYIENNP